MTTVDEIVSYIAEQALRVNNPDPVAQIYAANLEVSLAIGELMREVRKQRDDSDKTKF